MLYEYAVEPKAIASDWPTCRYISEKFGFDRARLLALYPGKWLPLAIDATAHLPDVEKKTVVEKLVRLKREASVKSGRAYDPALPDWLANAVAQQAIEPFRAILASQNPGARDFILTMNEVEDAHPLMAAPHDFQVDREATSLAAAMALLLQSANTVLFVDAYYDPFNARYQNTLRECLKLIYAAAPGALCEIHHKDRQNGPPAEAIEREAAVKFGGVIPAGMSVTIYRWREKPGADFHARYLLTNRGGVRLDAGFSAESGGQMTDMSLMDVALSQDKRKALGRTAGVYELIDPVLQIDSTGRVKRM